MSGKDKSTPIIGINTDELDRFLAYAEDRLNLDGSGRHRLFDELIRLSGNRFGLTKARIVVDRTAMPPTAVISIFPTRELIENVDAEIARQTRAANVARQADLEG